MCIHHFIHLHATSSSPRGARTLRNTTQRVDEEEKKQIRMRVTISTSDVTAHFFVLSGPFPDAAFFSASSAFLSSICFFLNAATSSSCTRTYTHIFTHNQHTRTVFTVFTVFTSSTTLICMQKYTVQCNTRCTYVTSSFLLRLLVHDCPLCFITAQTHTHTHANNIHEKSVPCCKDKRQVE